MDFGRNEAVRSGVGHHLVEHFESKRLRWARIDRNGFGHEGAFRSQGVLVVGGLLGKDADGLSHIFYVGSRSHGLFAS
jgi:hypothetical protein